MYMTLIITLSSPNTYSIEEIVTGQCKEVAQLPRDRDPEKWITNRYILPEAAASYLRREIAAGIERLSPIFRAERR